MEELEERATILEATFVSNPDADHYQKWQQVLRSLSAARIAQTSKALLFLAQQVFEFGGKNGKLLAWLARGNVPFIPIDSIRDEQNCLLTTPSRINILFCQLRTG